jgi:hypothetical protein
VFALFAIVEVVVSCYVEPLIYSKTTEVSAVGLLIAAMFWTWLWGSLGLLLSTPMTVCLAVLGKYVPSLRFLATLLGEEPPLAPDLKFYQRLLALDQDGANEIVETCLKDWSRVEVFDSLLIPALKYAKRDFARDELQEREWAFIMRVVTEIVEELEGAAHAGETPDTADSIGPAPRTKVVGVAVDDRADELVLRMLAQVLPPDRCELEIVTDTSSPLQLSGVVADHDPDLILISHLPPGGLTLTRYLIKRLRTRLVETPIVVGFWKVEAEMDSLTEQLKAAGASDVAGSIAVARDRILDPIAGQVQLAHSPFQTPALSPAGLP